VSAFNLIVLLGFTLISGAIGFMVYVENLDSSHALIWAIYAFGFALLAGVFTLFPAGTKVKDEWGQKVRVGNFQNLSKIQATIFLGWVFLGGLYSIYLAVNSNGL
jgi:hypothetical protein